MEVLVSRFGEVNGRPDCCYFDVLLQVSRQVTRIVKYADGHLLLDKSEAALQAATERLNVTGGALERE